MDRAPEIAVVGAGVFGLSVALRLAQAGRAVQVFDPSGEGAPSASRVAAGMLAPIAETLAEGGDRAHLERLLLARDLWPAFAEGVPGLVLERSGSDLLCGGKAEVEAMIARLSAWGIDFSLLPPPRLGLHAPGDWRLDAPTALAAMRAALVTLGVAFERVEVEPCEGALHAGGAPLQAQAVIIAAGYDARGFAAMAPELRVLTPIKGQLVAFSPGNGDGGGGAALRGGALYVAPQATGARAGATMEPGASDVEIDPAAIDRMRRAATALSPGLNKLPYRGEAGVRAATPDGWPLIGASGAPGLVLATGARRNGWLLAPLASQIVLDAVTGAAPHPLAHAFHPGRFTR